MSTGTNPMCAPPSQHHDHDGFFVRYRYPNGDEKKVGGIGAVS